MTKGELIAALQANVLPDEAEVLICDLQNDEDEKFHFKKINGIDTLRVLSQSHLVLSFNE